MTASMTAEKLPNSTIRLRAIEHDDLPALQSWWNDPDLWREIGSRRRLTALAHVETWYEELLERTEPHEGRTFAIADDAGRLLGTAWYSAFDLADRHSEIGLYIGDEYDRNHGYGAVACRALASYLFNELGLNKLRLIVSCDNLRAIGCYEKVGFSREGLLRQHRFFAGSFHDFLLMGLLATELKRS
ncbi:MAG: GNAT family N-acetyltransferase [Cyanobacteria bacterium NC_groundwater_1444_Ag_S-0.65um_54_12]|nr:GNAT family N-acetyltransferase [Cyanobacteria bacterium NC_groundwater_1444_Ag_S-0.65um_54_12]